MKDYNLTELEQKALDLCDYWQKESKRIFPNYRHAKISKTGDPRKCSLFRHCYTILREMSDKLKPEEYEPYIQAQLLILRQIANGLPIEEHPLVEPQILLGPKAWTRWLICQKKIYSQLFAPKLVESTIDDNKIIKILNDDKKFLLTKIDKINKQFIKDNLVNQNMNRWVAQGKLSPYFIIMSSTVKEHLDEIDKNFQYVFGIDPKIYINQITNNIKQQFIEIFKG